MKTKKLIDINWNDLMVYMPEATDITKGLMSSMARIRNSPNSDFLSTNKKGLYKIIEKKTGYCIVTIYYCTDIGDVMCYTVSNTIFSEHKTKVYATISSKSISSKPEFYTDGQNTYMFVNTAHNGIYFLIYYENSNRCFEKMNNTDVSTFEKLNVM